MPNESNIKLAIKVLERVSEDHFDLNYEFVKKIGNLTSSAVSGVTREEFDNHVCGTCACLGGQLALSDEGNALGFLPDIWKGRLLGFIYEGQLSSKALEKFLGLSGTVVGRLFGYDNLKTQEFYGKEVSQVTPNDVIHALEELLEEEVGL